MPIQMIVSDLDDTLLNSDLTLSEADMATLRQLEAMHLPLVLSSGRATPSVLKIADRLFPDKTGKIIIAYNGAEIVDLQTGKLLFHRYLPRHYAAAIADLAERESMTVQIYRGDCFLVPRETPEARLYASICDLPFRVVGSLRPFMDFDPPKLLIHADPKRLAALYPEIKATVGNRVTLTYSKPHYLEAFNRSVSKGAALNRLARYLHIPLKAVLAMGDSPNDLSMLKTAGVSVAVANAHPDIRSAASAVTRATHDESPLTEVFQRFIRPTQSA